ncbi:unnamed protein product [Ambrosiozyma monospora]|uniref:Unnamed protein product n=1 Tax=Ambrosiozyma monospora TaxID=43982 RepID=A0A9W6YQ75_AMBMO|nr:unnamed protein product [Ambrosiozyma monospora]
MIGYHQEAETTLLTVADGKYVIPNSFEEMLKSPQRAEWLIALDNENRSLSENDVYELVNVEDVPAGTKIVTGRYVNSVKVTPEKEEVFKTRLVAKGFMQKVGENYIESFAPVSSFDSLRFVLAYSAINNWPITQVDAKTAFLNGKLDFPIYFKPPTGSGTDTSKCVWLLKRSLYGLCNSPNCWFTTCSLALESFGFTPSKVDPCLFYKSGCIFLLYVDDGLCCGSNQKIVDDVIDFLSSKFVMKNLGAPSMFLGVNIDKVKQGYHINLRDSISKIENEYGVKPPLKLIDSPLSKSVNLFKSKTRLLKPSEHSVYRSIVGTILFLANTVRLDVAYPVSLLSQFLAAPQLVHLNAAKRVLQFLVQTKTDGILYAAKDQPIATIDARLVNATKPADQLLDDFPDAGKYKIHVVTDASFAPEPDRKSQSGYVTLFNNNVVSWGSVKQKVVALSTAESEYIGATEAIKSGICFSNLLTDLGLDSTYIELSGDNIASLHLAAHKTKHQSTKHIDIKLHFIRNLVKEKRVKLTYVNTTQNLADMLTKVLDGSTLRHLKCLIMMKKEECEN